MAVAKTDPALLAFVGIVVRFVDRKGLPQLYLAGAIGVMGTVRRWWLAQRQSLMTDGADHRVHDVQDRLGRTEARGDRQVPKLPRPALEEIKRILGVGQRPCEALELFAGFLETRGV